MISDNEVYVIAWSQYDGIGFGIVSDVAYEDYTTATHIQECLKKSDATAKYEVIKVSLVRGTLS